MELKNNQIEKSLQLLKVVKNYGIAYLWGEVRSGKTGTALNVAKLLGAKNTLIITKKKAISDIEKQYQNFRFTFNLSVINFESLHKIDNDFDFVIIDEAHSISAYPKPSLRTKLIKEKFSNKRILLMSGTPAIESYSQWFHQFWVSVFTPFSQYKNFYRWADIFVNKKEKKIGTHSIIDYSDARTELIDDIIKPYIVKMTQAEAGIDIQIKEVFLHVKTPDSIQAFATKLLNNKAIKLHESNKYIMADTPTKMQTKIHQILNGTCLVEDEHGATEPIILSNFKVDFIKEKFKEKKIIVMYYYQSERKMLEEAGIDCIQQSSTEGVNLSEYDAIVYLNFGFSGKNFVQSRDRLSSVTRTKENIIYFIFEEKGINEKIYNRVSKKQDFNLIAFKKDYETKR